MYIRNYSNTFIYCRYYHNEKDIDEVTEEPTTTNELVENIELTDTHVIDNTDEIVESNLISSTPSSGADETDTDTPKRDSSDEKSRTKVLTEINIEAKNNRNIENIAASVQSNSSTPSISLTQSPSTETEIEPRPSCSTESTSVSGSAEDSPTPSSTLKIRQTCNKLKNIKSKFIAKPAISCMPKANITEASTSNIEVGKMKKILIRPSSISTHSTCSDNSARYSSSGYDSPRSAKKKDHLKSNTGNNNNKINRKLSKNDTDTSNAHTPGNISFRSLKRSSFLRKMLQEPTSANINISSDFCKDTNDIKCDEQSNMFLYIDLHGHASKKGVFMYGNYLPKIAESVECMLLPRLMSLNSHHFHFDACVFSERNMYHK